MRPENAIEVKAVTKKFKVYMDKGHTLKEKTLFRKRRKYEERRVLDGISFQVRKGETVGLIGHNGCGKSTILKLLTKIMYPDSGTIEMRGRVSSLIELGAGFHPDMSGRENIYINASIFGLTRKEIDKRIPDIIAFSELAEFIDHPVRTYSSGMYMRLAFSVAINVDADILLIDEILAVGDAGFQAKCFNRLREIKALGTTIVIVSHSMGQIEQICGKSIWIHEGSIRAEGRPRDVNPQYLDYMEEQRQVFAEKERLRKQEQEAQKENSSEAKGKTRKKDFADIKKENQQADLSGTEKEAGTQKASEKGKKRWGNGKARITAVHLLDNEEKEIISLKTGSAAAIKIDYQINEIVEDAVIGIGIYRIDGVHCYGTNTRIDKMDPFDLTGHGSVRFEMDAVSLLPGSYLLDTAIECGLGIPVDYFKEAHQFEVFSAREDVGVARIDHKWVMARKRGT